MRCGMRRGWEIERTEEWWQQPPAFIRTDLRREVKGRKSTFPIRSRDPRSGSGTAEPGREFSL